MREPFLQGNVGLIENAWGLDGAQTHLQSAFESALQDAKRGIRDDTQGATAQALIAIASALSQLVAHKAVEIRERRKSRPGGG